jgi:hypothetical protein
MSDIITQATGWLRKWIPISPRSETKVSEVERVVIREVQNMVPANGRIFIRLAGISGAVAVAIGAYGAHGIMCFYENIVCYYASEVVYCFEE